MGIDIRYVNAPYTGPKLEVFDDGSFTDIWGVRKRPMPNEYGDYAESIGLPYANWQTVEEAMTFNWPNAASYDYSAVPHLCARHPEAALAAGSFGVQDFINGVAFGRGVGQVLIDIAHENPVYLFLAGRRGRKLRRSGSAEELGFPQGRNIPH